MAHSAANSAVIYDSTSDAGESDASTCEEGPNSMGRLSIMARVRSLQQENTVLKIEVDTLKLRCKNLKEENEELRRARVNLVSFSAIFCAGQPLEAGRKGTMGNINFSADF